MKLNFLRLLPLLLVGLGAACIASFYLHPIHIFVDGQEYRLFSFALTPAEALREYNLSLAPEDHLDVSPTAWIPADGVLRLTRARPVWLWVDGAQVGFLSPDRIPANWLARAGLRLYPGDLVYLAGRPVDPLQPVSAPAPYTLQMQPALAFQLSVDGAQRTLYSTAPTLGAALAQAGLRPAAGDRLSPSFGTPLQPGLQASIRRARTVRVRVGKEEITLRSAAQTVGELLSVAGLAPQGMDYTIPGPGDPVPATGEIRLVRVRETVQLAQKFIPFKSTLQPTPGLELDQRQVIQPGQVGVTVRRERLRLEDGVEVRRVQEGEWTVSEPRDQVVGVGTTPGAHALDTPSGQVEYYRAVTVYATSYSPCRQGYDHCSLSTSSGRPLQKGIVAVTLEWYRLLKGSRVYIPGYGIGVIADVGGGIPGTYWIDLGYSDQNYEQWNQNVTIYFLTPAPASVPARLP